MIWYGAAVLKMDTSDMIGRLVLEISLPFLSIQVEEHCCINKSRWSDETDDAYDKLPRQV